MRPSPVYPRTAQTSVNQEVYIRGTSADTEKGPGSIVGGSR